MRLAFFGNTCNNLYQIVKAIRAESDHDAHLFVDGRADPQQLPESDDPELAGAYPPWIHRGNYLPAAISSFAPYASPLLRELDAFDALVVSGYGVMLAAYTRTPTFFLATGGDLTMYPFPFRYLGNSLLRRVLHFVRCWGQRRGIRRCTEVWTQPFYPFQRAIEALGLPADRLQPTYLLIDAEKFRPGLPAPALRERAEFVVFHPSRLHMSEDRLARETGDWKANDRLIRGFAEFWRNTGRPRAVLAMIDRSQSRDREPARQLVAELGIAEAVVWLKPPREFGYSRDELIPLYSAADVVADDFGAGWFGSIVLEGLALGRPVVSYVEEASMRELYPWHPLVNARTPLQIAQALERLYRDPSERARIGADSRRWIQEFHSHSRVQRLYLENLSNRLARLAGPSAAGLKAGPR